MAKATGKAAQQDEGLKEITPVGTVCFPAIWTPKAFEAGKEPNYGLVLVFDEDEDLTKLKKCAGRALVKKWGDKAKGMHASGKLKLPFRPAEDYGEYGAPFEEGRIMINVKSRNAPGVVNERAKPIMQQMDFYAGCRARCSVYAHAYDTMGNKGVTFLLNNVQKTGDGERLSGRMNPEDEFDAVEGSKGGSEEDDIPF